VRKKKKISQLHSKEKKTHQRVSFYSLGGTRKRKTHSLEREKKKADYSTIWRGKKKNPGVGQEKGEKENGPEKVSLLIEKKVCIWMGII